MLFKQKIKDWMIPIQNYAIVSQDVTLRDAALSLKTSYCELDGGMCSEAGPRTVLVVDKADKLVGIIDFESFLKVLIPEIAGGLSGKLAAMGVSLTYAEADASSMDESLQGLNARVIKNSEAKVRDFMLKVRGTIDADDSVMDGLKKMFKNKITVIPVYEKNQLVGVLRDTDLFLAVTEILDDGKLS
jgi:CBS domain-containing protein